MSEKDLTVDEKVSAWVVAQYQENGGQTVISPPHLRTCTEIVVTDTSAFDSEYGCDTGCAYARLTATLSCAHGFKDEFEYGNWGELPELLKEIEEHTP
jgi:hypothetical protein